ncbi:uncharacterized protein LOC114325263 isoform X1 [Diabrotica virgifera virgifera]|uniref:LEM domain-containing protein n=1 Tax=Diabrotica virgifera virgifera TaxID=50390 RepID=A0ABM5IB93_DIAVI|nr:uncharacterized protein LOC114325263 isoform X1 [Diabrotica virgifera virgifera]XP_028129075.2 uncharacterized protein LOC114325263 isoform X1 [Diabrotica virgifera virgifera]
MVDVDKLTDAELRTKLLEFGFPVMPITGTTRKVMAKKLKMLLENKNKIGGGEGRRSLGRYSSEDESDNDAKVTKKKDNRRATMAAPLMQPPASSPKLRKSTRYDDEPEAPPSPVKRDIRTVTTTSSTRSQKIIKNAQDEFDTGSDSESDLTNYNSKGFISDQRGSPLKSTLSSTSKYSPSKSVESSYFSTKNISNYASASPSRVSTYNSPSLASEYATDRLNQIRSRLSLNTPSYDKPSYTTSEDREETPFLSNFTKKLSTLSSPQKNDYDYKNDIIKEHDANGSASVRTQLSSYRATRGRDTSYDYRLNKYNILQNNFMSFGVLALVALFFIVLAIMYMGMKPDTSVISSDFTLPPCVEDDPNSKKWVNCISKRDANNAMHLLEVLKPELQKRAETHFCSDSKVFPQMTEFEIEDFCVSNFEVKNTTQVYNDLRNLMLLCSQNAHWGINVAQTDDKVRSSRAVTEEDLVKDMEEVFLYSDVKLTSLVMLKPDLPFKCSFVNSLSSWKSLIYSSFSLIFQSSLFLIIVFGLLYTLNVAYKYYKHHAQQEKDELGFMVERIIDILQSKASEDSNMDDFVVINHARDMILPVGDRKKKASTWAKAVKFINENESRVRTEIQEVKGEPFEVWRWIGSANLSMSGDEPSFTYRQGRRIVDPEFFIREVLKFPHKFMRFCSNSDITFKSEVRDGFLSIFVLECRKCKAQHSVCNEESESDLLDVNLAFVAGVISLGLNFYGLNEICSSLRMPLVPLESYNEYLDEIYKIYNETTYKDDSLSKIGDDSVTKEQDIETLGLEHPTLRTSTPKIPNTNNLNQRKLSPRSNIPKPQLRSDTYEEKKTRFLKALEKTPQEIDELQKMTLDQKDSSVWVKERRQRLTASNFGRICKLRDSTDRKNVVEELLNSKFFGNKYTKYGNDNEPNALKDFEKLLGVKVVNCGVFVSKDYPFLAASPDGLIGKDGLVEIKCPYKSQNVTPEEGIRSKLIQCATLENNVFKLKREDKYYYQVQGQLFVTGRQYCYFVVWTPLGLLYERIIKDEQFWNNELQKLEEFYFDHLLPALLTEN